MSRAAGVGLEETDLLRVSKVSDPRQRGRWTMRGAADNDHRLKNEGEGKGTEAFSRVAEKLRRSEVSRGRPRHLPDEWDEHRRLWLDEWGVCVDIGFCLFIGKSG